MLISIIIKARVSQHESCAIAYQYMTQFSGNCWM